MQIVCFFIILIMEYLVLLFIIFLWGGVGGEGEDLFGLLLLQLGDVRVRGYFGVYGQGDMLIVKIIDISRIKVFSIEIYFYVDLLMIQFRFDEFV